MKKILLLIIFLSMAFSAIGQEAKYVFYFIGDGMGVNEVGFTQYYKASIGEDHGTKNLLFADFPYGGFATTWSANNQVTDSAASGTALATGNKTGNGMLGVDQEGKILESVASKAKKQGKKVAIVTTVGVNHATPAAFFAHQKSRKNYDQIVFDMTAAGFDFYAGANMLKSEKDRVEGLDYKKEFKNAGYTLVRNKSDYNELSKKANKILFIPDKEHSICCAIDRKPGAQNTTLSDFVSSAIDFLMKDGCKNGFFMMAEGGRIDGGAHGNDAAYMVKEILDMEEAVSIAYQFYLKHPKETAIIVTSDHDTGGSAIQPKKFSANIIQYQTASSGEITKELKKTMMERNVSWEDFKDFISERTGLFTKVTLKEEDEKELRSCYDETIAKAQAGNVTDDFGYNNNAVIVSKSISILNKYAGISWTTRTHSASFVPVYYIGPRPELFCGATDNAKIGRGVAKITLK